MMEKAPSEKLRPVTQILLVDDDPDSAYLLKRDLLRAFPGAQIREVPSCAALQVIALASPDLLVSAYRLLGVTGSEFVAQIRGAGGRFPIALVSSMPVYRPQAIQAGADLFLSYEDAKQLDSKLRALPPPHFRVGQQRAS